MGAVIPQNNLLEEWIERKIGAKIGTLTRKQLDQYQLQTVWETICRAYGNSPFYRSLLKDFKRAEMSSLANLQDYPFTTADHIREQALQFLCVSQSDISRIVTLDTSGTTGKAKRIYFTAADQELTVDFFQQGMSTMITPGERVLILLPGERSGSVGDLLGAALQRAGAIPVRHGVIGNIAATLEIMVREKIDCLVGIPVQILALARYCEFYKKNIQLKNVLLSTDYVPDVIIQELQRMWGCQVFEHYGMTEMGLGGGIDCGAHAGYHLREADLYVEIIDEQGQPVPEGQEGEVVFTTLTRQGMPLIRYRTGDMSRFLSGACPCGTILRRLERISKRKSNLVFLNQQQCFTIADLDERVFSVPRVLDYTVSVDSVQLATKLTVSVSVLGKLDIDTECVLYEALNRVPVIGEAIFTGRLSVIVKLICSNETLLPSPVKRRIMELKEADGK